MIQFTEKQIIQICKLRQEGLKPCREIAKIIGNCTASDIYFVLMKNYRDY